jgi:hypothetical protein
MTISQHVNQIGNTGSILADGLTVQVRITDVKQAYGVVRYAVTPVAGSGSVWVNADRVRDITGK